LRRCSRRHADVCSRVDEGGGEEDVFGGGLPGMLLQHHRSLFVFHGCIVGTFFVEIAPPLPRRRDDGDGVVVER